MEKRLYELEETGTVYEMPEKHCVFCKHCTDIFYDYTNGPYGFTCDKNIDHDGEFSCDSFEDDGYVFDEEAHKKRLEEKARIQAAMILLKEPKNKAEAAFVKEVRNKLIDLILYGKGSD